LSGAAQVRASTLDLNGGLVVNTGINDAVTNVVNTNLGPATLQFNLIAPRLRGKFQSKSSAWASSS
jgi:hypothetical protein